MTLEDSIHGLRLRVLHRAQELGDVSRACRPVLPLAEALSGLRAGGATSPAPRDTSRTAQHRARRGGAGRAGNGAAWPAWGPALVSGQRERPKHDGSRLAPAPVASAAAPRWPGHPAGAPGRAGCITVRASLACSRSALDAACGKRSRGAASTFRPQGQGSW